MFYIINTAALANSNGNKEELFLKIGRGQDSDVRVTDDISVSRAHAFIHRDRQTGSYYITDNNSKFGTLL